MLIGWHMVENVDYSYYSTCTIDHKTALRHFVQNHNIHIETAVSKGWLFGNAVINNEK
jgi:hypothetical protein